MTEIKRKKRSTAIKRVTKEALVLRYLRESRKLSMRRAAKVVGISEAQINHGENGRRDLTPDFVMKLCQGYGYSYQEFLDFVTDKKESPEHHLSECVEILKRLAPDKLRTVKTILQSF